MHKDGYKIVFRLQEIFEKQADLIMGDADLIMGDIFLPFVHSTVLCMQPPSGKAWSTEPLTLPCVAFSSTEWKDMEWDIIVESVTLEFLPWNQCNLM